MRIEQLKADDLGSEQDHNAHDKEQDHDAHDKEQPAHQPGA